jgi:hypothetical protein
MTTMFSAIRRRMHVSPATAIATLALIFAITGGAYAAKKYLITSTKQISPSVLKALQGKAGPAGANGGQGLTGSAGAQGPAGSKGENGAAGTNGTNGTPGVSVSSVESATKAIGPCKTGGSEFTSASGKTFACNGKEGTFGGQALPAGKTLRGAWSAYSYGEAEFPNPGYGTAGTAASFALPISGVPTTHYIGVGDGEGDGKEAEAIVKGECKGKYSDPGAAAGNLCIFAESEVNLFSFGPTISLSGDPEETIGFRISAVSGPAKGVVSMEGSWAVTG